MIEINRDVNDLDVFDKLLIKYKKWLILNFWLVNVGL